MRLFRNLVRSPKKHPVGEGLVPSRIEGDHLTDAPDLSGAIVTMILRHRVKLILSRPCATLDITEKDADRFSQSP